MKIENTVLHGLPRLFDSSAFPVSKSTKMYYGIVRPRTRHDHAEPVTPHTHTHSKKQDTHRSCQSRYFYSIQRITALLWRMGWRNYMHWRRANMLGWIYCCVAAFFHHWRELLSAHYGAPNVS